MHFHIELGDDRRYLAKGAGTVRFEMESRNPLYLRDVLYIPGLKKYLVSVATLENKGYEIIFSKGKAYIKPSISLAAKQIEVTMKNLYKLQVETTTTLGSIGVSEQNHDLGEFWHRRMGHLHHGALKILRDIATGLPQCSVDQHDMCKGCTLGKYDILT